MPTYRLLQINDSNGGYWVIVSDEEIKVADWVFDEMNNRIFKALAVSHNFYSGFFKVIAQSRQVHEGVPLIKTSQGVFDNYDVFEAWKNREDRYMSDLLTYASGYNAAKKKYRFTEDDVIEIFDRISECGWCQDTDDSWFHPDETGGFKTTKDLIEYYKNELSLNKPKQYQVELEMEDCGTEDKGSTGQVEHTSTTGETFIMGIRPKLTNGKVTITKAKEV